MQQPPQPGDEPDDESAEPLKPAADRYQQFKLIAKQTYESGSPTESDASESLPSTTQEQILKEVTTHLQAHITQQF